ncbi:unnamed protein product [Hermetia illucens]|uniref:Uncharacterized protein n=1 Tax=Hermetia illucens TaxID=343691 RepID=A0A7R8UIX4_HERIL|nr:unnamed protein product [Hermetia illucens]
MECQITRNCVICAGVAGLTSAVPQWGLSHYHYEKIYIVRWNIRRDTVDLHKKLQQQHHEHQVMFTTSEVPNLLIFLQRVGVKKL